MNWIELAKNKDGLYGL